MQLMERGNLFARDGAGQRAALGIEKRRGEHIRFAARRLDERVERRSVADEQAVFRRRCQLPGDGASRRCCSASARCICPMINRSATSTAANTAGPTAVMRMRTRMPKDFMGRRQKSAGAAACRPCGSVLGDAPL
jgi:hypothetical protein